MSGHRGKGDSAAAPWLVAILTKAASHNANPDLYAAAICIRVRPDCLLADILSAEAAASPYTKGATDSEAIRIL